MKPEEITLDTEFEVYVSFSDNDLPDTLHQAATFAGVLRRHGVEVFTCIEGGPYDDLHRWYVGFCYMVKTRMAIKIGLSLERIAQDLTSEHFDVITDDDLITYQATVLERLKTLIASEQARLSNAD